MRHVTSSRTSECADGAGTLSTSLLGLKGGSEPQGGFEAQNLVIPPMENQWETCLLPDDIAKTAEQLHFVLRGQYTFKKGREEIVLILIHCIDWGIEAEQILKTEFCKSYVAVPELELFLSISGQTPLG